MRKFLSVLMAALFVGGSAMLSANDREHTLKVYNWADYIDEDLISEFEQWYEQQTGESVKIVYQLFDINEIMLSKIELGHEDFDVVCPSDYIIERMLCQDLLLPIGRDFGQTPNYIDGNVSPFIIEKMNCVRGGGKNANDYAVGYMWGTTGLMYNPKFLTREEVSTWDILKDPKVKGKLLMKNAFRDVYTSLLIAMNKDEIASGAKNIEEIALDASPKSIALVESYLNEVKDNVSGWEEDFGKEMMTKEKGWLNFTWSGDAAWAKDEASKVGVQLEYAVPEEGSTVWFDGWVIPKYAKNVKAARYFINFLCMAQNAVRNMDAIGYVSCIGGPEVLESMTDESISETVDASYFFGEGAENAHLDYMLYPDVSVIRRCGMMHDNAPEDTEALMAMWTRVKGDNANAMTYIILAVAILALIGGFVAAHLSKKSGRKRKRPLRK